MFIRHKKMANGRTKVQIVKSVRTGTKVQERVLRHVGTARYDHERDVIIAFDDKQFMSKKQNYWKGVY